MIYNCIFSRLLLPTLVILASAHSLSATTWYIRADGGDRSQCNGKADAPYLGSGQNQPCALKHPFYLFTTDPPINKSADTPTWIISGGDTVILDNSEFRIGYKTNDQNGYWNFVGCRGNPYSCHNPPIPAGTVGFPTRIVGKNWQSGCAEKAKLTGGIGVTAVLNLSGAKNVVAECIEISDFAQCGTGAIGVDDSCVRGGFPKSDYALRGIMMDLASDGVLLRNLDIHGTAQMGIRGRIGGTITADNIRIAGIQGGGWDNDDGGYVFGTGTVIIRNSLIEWSGCMEEYPRRSPLPYYKCFDQSHGGYGDGLGLLIGEGMRVEIDRSTFRHNLQDGVDLLYVHGVTPTATVTRSQSYGNGGQQWKLGPFNKVTFQNNLTIANCRRFADPFPGAPETYNQIVTDHCRAFDGVAVTVANHSTVNWFNNTTVGYTSTMHDIICTKTIDTFKVSGRGGATPEDPLLGIDGIRRSFELSQVPNPLDVNGLKVNNTKKSFGTMGVDSGKQWYWIPGTRTIVQDPSEPTLAVSDILTVQYTVPGSCQNTKFNYANNIFRAYTRLDTGRKPVAFFTIDLDQKKLFDQSMRQNNLFCGSVKPVLYPSETYLQDCPGNWLNVESWPFNRESDLDTLDLRLSPVSVARDTGISIPTVQDDYDGVPRYYGVGPDIGAYEVAPLNQLGSVAIGLQLQPATSSAKASARLTWSQAASATYYVIQRRNYSEPGRFVELGQVATPGYSDSRIVVGRSYCYRVQPNNAINSGNWSPEVCIATNTGAIIEP